MGNGDTHIPSDISRGYTKHGDTHITVTPVAWLSRALRAFLHAANCWFESHNDQCFVFRSYIFFFKIFPKIAFTTQGSYYCMTVNYYY